MEKNSQDVGGSFATGFGLGAVAGVGFAHFLQSKDGEELKKNFSEEFETIKEALFVEGLIPSSNMTAVEIFAHMATSMASMLADEPEEIIQKDSEKKQKNQSMLLRQKQSKKPQKRFKGS